MLAFRLFVCWPLSQFYCHNPLKPKVKIFFWQIHCTNILGGYFQDFGTSATSGGVTFAPSATAIEPEPIEIGQDKLKTQLVSCISDLEKDRWSDHDEHFENVFSEHCEKDRWFNHDEHFEIVLIGNCEEDWWSDHDESFDNLLIEQCEKVWWKQNAILPVVLTSLLLHRDLLISTKKKIL